MSALPGRPQWSRIINRNLDELHWQEHAACVLLPIEVFFPERGDNITSGARRVCGGCPVKDECLDYALAHKERHGVWGGKSERERREIQLGRRLRRPNRVNA